MQHPILKLRKGEGRRISAGHPWLFSNEIDVKQTALKSFQPGDEVSVVTHDNRFVGNAYVNPHSLIAARIYSTHADACLNQSFFQERLRAALHAREALFDAPYYRLVFGEADGLPGLVIDRFGDNLVVQINTAGMETKKEILKAALLSILPKTHSILLRNDSRIRQQEGLETYVAPLYGEPPEEVTLIENGVSFKAPLWKGQKTGWFYDHRMNRLRLAQAYSKGKRVLDVFSYLGGWGIQAAVSGATQVDCIEASAFASEYIRQNAALNKVANKVTVITADAFDAMKQLIQDKRSYDVIVLDPPAFIKKAKDRKEGTLAYQRMNELALRLLTPTGVLITCSCSMQIDFADFQETLQRAAQRTKHGVQILERGHQGPDHPLHPAIAETDYLKAIFARDVAIF